MLFILENFAFLPLVGGDGRSSLNVIFLEVGIGFHHSLGIVAETLTERCVAKMQLPETKSVWVDFLSACIQSLSSRPSAYQSAIFWMKSLRLSSMRPFFTTPSST